MIPRHADDRDRPIRPKGIGPRERRTLAARHRLESARRAFKSQVSVLLHRVFALCLIGYCLHMWLPVAREPFLPLPRFGVVEVAILTVVTFAAIALGAAVFVRARWLLSRAYRALRERVIPPTPICLQCGYGLAGLPVEDDGCVTCPECRAAWAAAEQAS